MALMGRMRDLAPLFIISVGVIFVLFMVISDSNMMEAVGTGANNVGSVNGEDVTYQEFSEFLERARQNRQNQTGEEIPPEQLPQFRDQVWDAIVTQILTEQQMQKYDISVTDDEIREFILGDNPPEFLRQNFVDSVGNFDRAAYDQALFDPRNKEALLQAEDFARQQLLAQKLQSIVFASINVSEGEIKRKFIDDNVTMNAEYAQLMAAMIPDADIEFSDADLSEYYNDNIEEYKREAQRKIQYVMFEVAPSPADSAAAYRNLMSVYEIVVDDTADFSASVEIYSEEPYAVDTVSITEIPDEAIAAYKAEGRGVITEPVKYRDGMAILHVLESIESADETAKAAHILVASSGDDAADKAKADSLYNVLVAGADFAALAREHSKDPGSAAKGGDLGWFGKGQMVKPFEDAVFNGPVGEIQEPVKSRFGYHIIRTDDKASTDYVIESIYNEIVPSARTRDDIHAQASDFAFLAEENGFDKEAELAEYDVKESTTFTNSVFSVPGVGYNRALVQFAFDNPEGTITPVFAVAQGYVVGKVSYTLKEGVKPLEEVRSSIESAVKTELKLAKAAEILEQAKTEINGQLTQAPSVNEKIKPGVAEDFNLQGSIPSIGLEYAFSAAAYDAPLNEVAGPVEGNRGAYLLKVTKRTAFDSTAYSLQKNTIRNELLQQKKSIFYQQWLENLKDASDIEDERYRFFGR